MRQQCARSRAVRVLRLAMRAFCTTVAHCGACTVTWAMRVSAPTRQVCTCRITARVALTSREEMEKLGHKKSPPCMKYEVAQQLELTPVPDGYVWGGKEKNRDFLRTLRGRDQVNQSGPSGASGAATEVAEETDKSDEDYKSSSEEVDELVDDEPPPPSRKNAKSKGKAVLRQARAREDRSSRRPKQTLVQVLDTRLSEIHATLEELLKAEKAQLALKRKRIKYLISDDDMSSEAESDNPIGLRKRTYCVSGDNGR